MKKPKARRAWNSTLPAPSKSLPRSTKPPRKTKVKRVNQKRRREAFKSAFGEKASWIRSLPCVVGVYGTQEAREGTLFVRSIPECEGDMEAAHAVGRGAGGLLAQLIPMCRKHHHEQHTTGINSFEGKYHLSLSMAADLHDALYRASLLDSAVLETKRGTLG